MLFKNSILGNIEGGRWKEMHKNGLLENIGK